MNNLELKIQALKESFFNKVLDYEDKIADLRVQLTVMQQQLDEERAKNVQEDAKEDSED